MTILINIDPKINQHGKYKELRRCKNFQLESRIKNKQNLESKIKNNLFNILYRTCRLLRTVQTKPTQDYELYFI